MIDEWPKATFSTTLHQLLDNDKQMHFYLDLPYPNSLLEELEERSDSEVKSQEAQLRILAKAKTSLVTKLTG